jgi:quercetin dioxygenase-like cupin family protein
MTNQERHDDDLLNVLKDDGVTDVAVGDFENRSTVGLDELIDHFDADSWAARVFYNERFGGVLIRQMPGEGNRLHYHPDADECWVILEGEWEWFIEGQGTRVVGEKDIIVVQQGIRHQIKCIGDKPGIRLAITAPDVNHVYAEGETETA